MSIRASVLLVLIAACGKKAEEAAKKEPSAPINIKLITANIEASTVMRLKVTLMRMKRVLTAGDSMTVITVLREKNTTNFTMNTPTRGTMTRRVTGVGGTR